MMMSFLDPGGLGSSMVLIDLGVDDLDPQGLPHHQWLLLRDQDRSRTQNRVWIVSLGCCWMKMKSWEEWEEDQSLRRSEDPRYLDDQV